MNDARCRDRGVFIRHLSSPRDGSGSAEGGTESVRSPSPADSEIFLDYRGSG